MRGNRPAGRHRRTAATAISAAACVLALGACDAVRQPLAPFPDSDPQAALAAVSPDTEPLSNVAGVEAPDPILAEPSPTFQTSVVCYGRSVPPVIMVDGEVLPDGTSLTAIDQNDIESVEIVKGEAALERFGAAGRNGAILIRTKSKSPEQ